MTAALKRIVEEVQRLTEAERRELHALLERACGDVARPVTEMELEQKLAEEGLLTLPTPPVSPPGAMPAPVGSRGGPLSELLLEERR